MEKNIPSLTAYTVALMRAAHQVFDKPRILEDPVALPIIGSQGAAGIRLAKRRFKTKLQGYLRAIVVARSRFAEDRLTAAVKQGVRQYVVLGAGLDTFAYRNPHEAEGVRVFEVDHPATQQWKRKKLHVAKISIPETMAFIPVDFQHQLLMQQLQNAGFNTDEPAFFSWLGVTMYLRRETVMETMKCLSSTMSLGGEIVFDYVIHPSSQDFLRRIVFRLLSNRVKRVGEPWKSFFDPDSLIRDLKAAGVAHAVDMGPDEINALYFKGRKDTLMVGRFGHLMKARF